VTLAQGILGGNAEVAKVTQRTRREKIFEREDPKDAKVGLFGSLAPLRQRSCMIG
jgi:hypothetical protein